MKQFDIDWTKVASAFSRWEWAALCLIFAMALLGAATDGSRAILSADAQAQEPTPARETMATYADPNSGSVDYRMSGVIQSN